MPPRLWGEGLLGVHLFLFDDALSRKLIYAVKHRLGKDLCRFLAKPLARSVREVAGDLSKFTVTFAPRKPKSIREFGFDQAALLAEALAAELSLPDTEDLSRQIAALATRMDSALTTRMRRLRTRLTQLASAKVLTAPEGVYRFRREGLEGLSKRLDLSMARHLTHKRQSLERAVTGLGALNPLGVLGRGYALVQSPEGTVIPTAGQLERGERVVLRFADGTARAVVEETAVHNQETEEVIHHE